MEGEISEARHVCHPRSPLARPEPHRPITSTLPNPLACMTHVITTFDVIGPSTNLKLGGNCGTVATAAGDRYLRGSSRRPAGCRPAGDAGWAEPTAVNAVGTQVSLLD